MTGEVRYSVAMSLDGFIAPPDGSIAWLEPYAGGADFNAFLTGLGGILIGRDSFDLEQSLHGWDYALPTAIMTTRPVENLPANARPFSGDITQAITWLRQGMSGGDIWLFGGGRTAAHALRAGLIDRVELTVIPVLLGEGRPVFAGASQPTNLTLISAATGDKGVQTVVYRPNR